MFWSYLDYSLTLETLRIFSAICDIFPGFLKFPLKFPQNIELISKFKVLSTHTY